MPSADYHSKTIPPKDYNKILNVHTDKKEEHLLKKNYKL